MNTRPDTTQTGNRAPGSPDAPDGPDGLDVSALIDQLVDAFAYGTDDAADDAARALEQHFEGNPDALDRHHDQLQAAYEHAASLRADALVRLALPDATTIGRRRLPGHRQVHTLRLPNDDQVAVVVPAGTGTQARVARRVALLGGCGQCRTLPEPTTGRPRHATTCETLQPPKNR